MQALHHRKQPNRENTWLGKFNQRQKIGCSTRFHRESSFTLELSVSGACERISLTTAIFAWSVLSSIGLSASGADAQTKRNVCTLFTGVWTCPLHYIIHYIGLTIIFRLSLPLCNILKIALHIIQKSGKSPFLQICQLCAQCMTTATSTFLKQAFSEHVNRRNMKMLTISFDKETVSHLITNFDHSIQNRHDNCSRSEPKLTTWCTRGGWRSVKGASHGVKLRSEACKCT